MTALYKLPFCKPCRCRPSWNVRRKLYPLSSKSSCYSDFPITTKPTSQLSNQRCF